MTGYAYAAGDFDAAARSAAAAAEVVGRQELGTPLRAAAQALPGATSQGALDSAADQWGKALDALAKDCRSLDSAFATAGTDYDKAQSIAEAQMDAAKTVLAAGF